MYSVCLSNSIVDKMGSIRYQQRRSESHPKIMMRVGDTKIFATKPQCSFQEFYVKKEYLRGDAEMESFFFFYAVSPRANNGFKELNNIYPPWPTDKFQHQLAYIVCKHGWIEILNVFDKSLDIEGHRKGQDYPRGCGIGIVLTELCLIDPSVNSMKGKNKDKIKGIANEEGNEALRLLTPEMKELVKENCYKLVGLSMMANPPSAGHLYFSAAINMGYDKMYVDLTTDYKIYDTKIAKQNYKNGDIDACCGNDRCDAYDRNWIFCADMDSVITKFGKMLWQPNY